MKYTRIWPGLLFGASVICFVLAALWGLHFSPPDYQQGDAVRIMYVHVPASWMALMVYATIVGSSILVFVWRNPMAHLLGLAAAPLGLCFNTISLITGAIWGKPMWGAWWVWDARLTSVLVLWFLYVGYWYMAHAFQDREKGVRMAALYAILGGINLPIIKWSVNWWHTLHQPASILRSEGIAIHADFLGPLFTMFAAYLMFFVALWVWRIRTKVKERQYNIVMARLRS